MNIYDVIIHEYRIVVTNNYQILISRHGVEWRNETGDNLIFSMVETIDELMKENQQLKEKLQNKNK